MWVFWSSKTLFDGSLFSPIDGRFDIGLGVEAWSFLDYGKNRTGIGYVILTVTKFRIAMTIIMSKRDNGKEMTGRIAPNSKRKKKEREGPPLAMV